jgi:hypothetical protein
MVGPHDEINGLSDWTNAWEFLANYNDFPQLFYEHSGIISLTVVFLSPSM